MHKTIFMMICLCFFSTVTFAQSVENDSALFHELEAIAQKEKNFSFKTGIVKLKNSVQLNVPENYKFLEQKDAKYVVEDLWGNPPDNILGLLVEKDWSALDFDTWAFIVSYEDAGYVKDEDASSIDYDEMMDDLKKENGAINEERKKEGYEPMYFLGWASKPFYDSKNNILHWAKLILFGDQKVDTTVNYDVRILGRKGLLSLNAVGTTENLPDIKNHIPEIIHIATFEEGNKYSDFKPGIDKVAAYTVGGLVAGKVLAKAGILALILKNIKLVLLAIFGFFAAFRKKITSWFQRGKNTSNQILTDDESAKE